jgi:hypothetical protein
MLGFNHSVITSGNQEMQIKSESATRVRRAARLLQNDVNHVVILHIHLDQQRQREPKHCQPKVSATRTSFGVFSGCRRVPSNKKRTAHNNRHTVATQRETKSTTRGIDDVKNNNTCIAGERVAGAVGIHELAQRRGAFDFEKHFVRILRHDAQVDVVVGFCLGAVLCHFICLVTKYNYSTQYQYFYLK